MIPFPFQVAQFGRGDGSGPGNPWTPANLTTFPYLWPSPETAVTDAGSGACSQWNDAGSVGAAWVQNTAANRPLIVPAGLNGYRVLRGDGVNDLMPVAATAVFRNVGAGYFFIVWQRLSLAAAVPRGLFGVPNNSSASRFVVTCDTTGDPNKVSLFVRRLDGDSTTQVTATTDVSTGWHMALAQMDWSTGAGSIWVDGTLEATAPTLTTAGLTSNSASATQPRIMARVSDAETHMETPEVVIGREVLTTTEINKLFGYAAHKYALTSLLPALHPYKSVAPTV